MHLREVSERRERRKKPSEPRARGLRWEACGGARGPGPEGRGRGTPGTCERGGTGTRGHASRRGGGLPARPRPEAALQRPSAARSPTRRHARARRPPPGLRPRPRPLRTQESGPGEGRGPGGAGTSVSGGGARAGRGLRVKGRDWARRGACLVGRDGMGSRVVPGRREAGMGSEDWGQGGVG